MNHGQGPAGFSWGEALNAALPIAGLTAGLYAPHGAGQNIAQFAHLMALNQERDRAEKEREAEREAFRRYPDIIQSMPGSLEFPGLGRHVKATDVTNEFLPAPPEGYTERGTPRTETYQRMPTITEALKRAHELPTKDEATKAHLVKLVTQTRLPTMPEVPKELEQRRNEASVAEGLLISGRVTDPAEAQAIARSWATPHFRTGGESLLPKRPSPSERLAEGRAEKETAFQARLEGGEFDLATPQGVKAAYDAAVSAGAPQTAQRIAGGAGVRKSLEADERSAAFTGTTLPQLESRLATIATTKGIDPQDVEAVKGVLDVAKGDPSPQNQRKAAEAIANLPKLATQRKQFGDRMGAVNRRLDELKARAGKDAQAGNLAKAEQSVRFMMTRIDREIRQLSRDAEFADPKTQGQIRFEIDRLDSRRDQLESWMESVTGQRSETPGTDLPTPPNVPPPGPGPGPQQPKAGGDKYDALRKQGLLK